MSSFARPRLLPGAPRWPLLLVGTSVGLQVLMTVAGVLPGPDSVVRLVLGAATGLGTASAVIWRAWRVPHDSEVWRRICLGGCAVLACAAVGTLLTLVDELQGVADALVTWAPLSAFPLVYGGLVLWNRYSSSLGDPSDILNGLSAVLVVAAVLNLTLDRPGRPLAGLAETDAQFQIGLLAVTTVLALTGLSAVFLGGMQRDWRPWLVTGQFAALAADAWVSTLTGAAWPLGTAATGLGALGVTVAALLRSAAVPPQPTDPTTTTVGSFIVLLHAVGALVAESLGDPMPVVSWCAGLAATGVGVRLLMNVRDLGVVAISRREALTDELTGRANRRAMLRQMDEFAETGVAHAFVLLDLDRFKEVNDGLGHAAGDDLIRQVAARLQEELRSGDTLGRLSGDEFAVVAVVESDAEAAAVAEALTARLIGCFEAPFTVAGTVVHVGASIGVTWTRGDDRVGSAERLRREADAAMYEAKRSGGVVAYDAARHGDASQRLVFVEELRTAIDTGQLVLRYQPQIDIATGRPIGVEALVRWEHPDRGLLGPDAFIPAAELHGLMGPLTHRVLVTAVAQQAQWQLEGVHLRMSVNLSASNLLDADLPDRVAALLAEHGVAAGDLTLEVTESVLLSDPDRSRAVVAALRASGVGISIDDFGTGYCSLAYLREMPVTELKLDRSFTADLLTDPRTAAIVASTVDLAHRLGVRVVAEGVEDDATLDRLAALGCDESQGYLHARPLEAEVVTVWVPATAASSPYR